jgi:acetoin utilization protein AcuB
MVYTNPLVTIEETATVEEAAKLMKEWRIKHLPIVDKNGGLVGMLNDRDVIYAVPSLMSTMEEFCQTK